MTAAMNQRGGGQVGKYLLVWRSVVGSTGIGVARSALSVVQSGSARSPSLRAAIADHPKANVRCAAVVLQIPQKRAGMHYEERPRKSMRVPWVTWLLGIALNTKAHNGFRLVDISRVEAATRRGRQAADRA
jgi:hypothetical protein